MTGPNQLAVLVRMNLLAALKRAGGTAVIVLGMAAVVGVMVSILSLAVGAIRSYDNYASPYRVMIQSRGAQSEFQSRISRAAALKIADMPGIKKGADGQPMSAAETLTYFVGSYKSTKLDTGVPLRGSTPHLLEFRPEFKLVEGRMFTPGLREVIVGREASDVLESAGVGDRIQLQDGPWTVVGTYVSHSGADFGMFADAETLLSAMRRNDFASVTATLDNPTTLETLRAALAADPTLDVGAERESDYWLRIAGPIIGLYRFIGYGLGAIMGLGALFAALNIMYASVSSRILEIGTLRAIGFSPSALILSIVGEAVALAAFGASIGLLVAWACFNGRHYGAGHFNLVIDKPLALTGVTLAIGLGALAALFPAIRATRLPVATALQVR